MDSENNTIKTTVSLCPTCGRETLGRIIEEEGQAIMVKQCLTHGEARGRVESSAPFVRWIQQMPRRNLFTGLFLDVTSHCNMRCHPCYFPVTNTSDDMPLHDVLALAERTGSQSFELTGGEPTMRADLPQLVSALVAQGKGVNILTNGLALADPVYCDALLAAFGETTGDVFPVAISIHPESSSTPEQYAAKLRALDYIRSRGKRVTSLMFTIHALHQIEPILAMLQQYRDLCWIARIRSASPLWTSRPIEHHLFVSDLAQQMSTIAIERQIPMAIKPEWDNNLYHLNVEYGGIHCRLISWPDITNVDLDELHGCGPYALTRTGRILNVLHAGLVNGCASSQPITQERELAWAGT